MTDKYKELREALESGPTPGEWKQVDDLPYLHAFKEGQKTNHHFEVPCIGRFDYSPVDMKYIAAANPDTIRALLDERDRMREALKFYADQHHFNIADYDAWDTVSGEPPNFFCDELGTATLEDGSIARAALAQEQS